MMFHVYRSRPQSQLAPGHPVARDSARLARSRSAALEPSDWPHKRIAGFKALLKGGTVIPKDQDAITIIRSLPHGHVDAALGAARKIGLDRLLGPDGTLPRPRPGPGGQPHPRSRSKLAAARALSPDTATSSLGEQLGLGLVDENELYSALDWLAVRQPAVEAALAKRHLSGGTLVLYDVSSSYLEGRCSPLAQFGYSRDGKRGKQQIVYGSSAPARLSGGNRGLRRQHRRPDDPNQSGDQAEGALRSRPFVLVGDRGMITQAPITEDIKAAGLDSSTALPPRQSRRCSTAAHCRCRCLMTAIWPASPLRFPGERLIVCRNRALAAERARKREDLLATTERDLARIATAVARKRQPLRGKAEIGLEIGAVLDKRKMAKHFALDITDTSFSFARKIDEITVEAALDGLYVVAPACPPPLDNTTTVRSYKSPSLVEHAFRCIKTVDLQIRPIYHWLADRVHAHVFVCMLAYYLEWHMRQRLAPCSTTTPTRMRAKRNAPASSPKPSVDDGPWRLDFSVLRRGSLAPSYATRLTRW